MADTTTTAAATTVATMAQALYDDLLEDENPDASNVAMIAEEFAGDVLDVLELRLTLRLFAAIQQASNDVRNAQEPDDRAVAVGQGAAYRTALTTVRNLLAQLRN